MMWLGYATHLALLELLAKPRCRMLVTVQTLEFGLQVLGQRRVRLPFRLYGLQRLRIPSAVEDVVESFLELRPLAQRPRTVLLVTEHDMLQNWLRNAQVDGYALVELGAFVRQRDAFARLPVDGAYGPIQRLEGGFGLGLGDFHGSHDHHGRSLGVIESQLNVGLDVALADRSGVVDEALSRLHSRGQRSGDDVLEGFDDCGLSASVGADNDCEREADK